jgi:hypothetical protein
MSETVATQVERFRRLAERARRVEVEEAAALFRLAGRRSDAGLVFADAGRSAGRRAVGRTAAVAGLGRNGLGHALARRAFRTFDATLQRADAVTSALIEDPPSALATPGGSGCGFYGSALAEILRGVTDFDGAMFHVSCRARGDAVCRWSTRETA